jgi:O-antigen/teichoic acid export membrane protein
MLWRNSLWNLSGSALPAIAALITIPLLITALGMEGFGVVTLVSSVIGYFGVLDINLSAGAIKYLAEHHASGDRKRFAETFWFGALFYGTLGLLGALAIYFSAGYLVARFFHVSAGLHDDTVLAFQVGALGFALSQTQSYLLVVPQALQRYDRSAQTEAFFGVLVNVASVAAALAGLGVIGVIAVRVAVSSLNVLYLAWLIRRFELGLTPTWPRADVRTQLTSFSAYAYLSKIASTLHEHGDKLIVGALAGPVAVTFYTVPTTLASRILGLTYRLSSVIYPKASALAATERIHELRPVYLGAMRYVTYINLVALGMIVLAGDEFLKHWVGNDFVAQGYPILVLMTVALLVDSFTNVPSLVNDALGHPRITGKFALAKGLVGVTLIYAGASLAGIVGAAGAHLATSLVMTALFLIYVHGRTVPIRFNEMLREGLGRSLAVGFLVFGILFPLKWLIPGGLLGTVAIVSAALLTLLLAGIMFIVGVDERAALRAAARRLRF